jgi:hypothetical protein
MRWLFFMRRGERSLEIFPRTGTGIDESAVAKFTPCVQINRSALALRIRSKVPADAPMLAAFAMLPRKAVTLVPVQAQPTQVVIHGPHEFRLAALKVQVFIAEDERAAGGAGAAPRHKESAGVAQVQISGR